MENETFTLREMLSESIQTDYIIEDLIEDNTCSILVSSPKAGKTSLMIQAAYCISTGIPFLGMKTKKATVLYISMDTSKKQLQKRLQKMKIQPNENLIFKCTNYLKLGFNRYSDPNSPSFIEYINEMKEDYPDLKVVFVDLLDDIRDFSDGTENSNKLIREDLLYLQGICTNFDINIICLSHTRKAHSTNLYDSGCGPTQKAGAIDGAFMRLTRIGIANSYSVLDIGGRVSERKIDLEFDSNSFWFIPVVSQESYIEIDYNLAIIRNYITKKKHFEGSLSELCSQTNILISAKKLSCLLAQQKDILLSDGIQFYRTQRTSNCRTYIFDFIGDNDDMTVMRVDSESQTTVIPSQPSSDEVQNVTIQE